MCVMINTIVGKITVKPHEVINLKERILPPISRHLVEATEDDYLSFQEAKQGTVEAVTQLLDDKKEQSDTKVEETTVVENTENKVEVTTTKPEPVLTEEQAQQQIIDSFNNIGNNAVAEWVQQLFNKNMLATSNATQEIIQDTPENTIPIPVEDEIVEDEPSLVTQETEAEKEKKALEATIKELEETWKQTKAVRKKEKLAKQIKELKKQLEKF